MLVLSRKANETLQVGDNVTIKVVKVRGNTVQIGIQAPREISILRSELVPIQKKNSGLDTSTTSEYRETNSEIDAADRETSKCLVF